MLRIVIFVADGLVQEVIAEEDLEYLLIDEDVCDEEYTRTLKRTDGTEFTAASDLYAAETLPGAVQHYFGQVEIPE